MPGEREAIRDLWPEHLGHLSPEGSTMGQPITDDDHGVVCNCGTVLGWPEDAPPQETPHTSLEMPGAEHDPVPDEWTDQIEPPVNEHDTDPWADPSLDEPPVGSRNLPARQRGVVQAEDPVAAQIAIIDPTLPYGPADVERQLLDIGARIERGVHFQRYWEERHHYAKIAFTLANARALVTASGSDAASRKAQALLDCEDEYHELAICETMVRAVRETMHNLRSLQSGYQTVARSVGSSMQNVPQQGV